MENIEIKSTPKSPEVLFNLNGKLVLKGISILDSAHDFYTPLIEWSKKYLKEPAEKTEIIIDLEFFNTSSQLKIFELLSLFAELTKKGKEVEIIWYYEEDDIKEIGEDMANLLGMDFQFIKK